jgi:small-conductance mechanosensitive channel
MTLKSSFQDLADKLDRLRATFEEILQWAITQGKPEHEDHALVGRYDDATNDLIGLIEEAIAAAQPALQSVAQTNLSEERRALIICQSAINKVSKRYFSEMVSFEALTALDSLAKERRKQWPQWVSGVKDALDQCRMPIEEVSRALFECWQEITERASLVSVSVQATSTGQQISVALEKEDQAKSNSLS